MVLADRVAIVTGAGNGIGKATALALARAGAHVAAVDVDDGAAKVAATPPRHWAPGAWRCTPTWAT